MGDSIALMTTAMIAAAKRKNWGFVDRIMPRLYNDHGWNRGPVATAERVNRNRPPIRPQPI
jgi:hypothetical protein